MTRDEAVAACLARGGWSRGECEAWADSNVVGGVYCDGAIVVDEHGKRCVPRATLEAKQRAMGLDPRPAPAPVVHVDPAPLGWPPPAWAVVGALALAAVGALWLASRR